jgi:hypothetical protein
MSYGVFIDKKHHPTEVEIIDAIGPLLPTWQALVRHVRATYPVQEDFKFLYGKNYGWALRFRIKTQLLVNLYPSQGGFTAQVNLNPAAVEKALGMQLGQNAQQAITRAHPYPEGRWVFIPVESEKDAQDIQSLLALRVAAKRLVK